MEITITDEVISYLSFLSETKVSPPVRGLTFPDE
jgi:hypothetical protein